jgi:hypothetical protein
MASSAYGVDMAEGVEMQLIWPGVDDVGPIVSANQILVQPGAVVAGSLKGFILNFGHAAPPVVLGDAQEQQLSLSALSVVPVRTLIRLSVSPARLREFSDALRRICDEMDREGES